MTLCLDTGLQVCYFDIWHVVQEKTKNCVRKIREKQEFDPGTLHVESGDGDHSPIYEVSEITS